MTTIRDVNNIVELHNNIINEFGGAHGIIDIGLLKSAVEKPFTGLSNGTEFYPTLVQKAAVLFEAIVNYHPFVDGNKRLAAIVTNLFLDEKGYKFIYTDKEIVNFSIRVSNKRLTISEIEKWIKSHIRKRKK